MWYVVDIWFGRRSNDGTDVVQCESCCVLFEADTAPEAYHKGELWGREHEDGNSYKYAGIHHMYSLDDDRPGDGDEIGGQFFEEAYFWQRLDSFIPERDNIATVRFEANRNTPIGELMTDEQKALFDKVLREDEEED